MPAALFQRRRPNRGAWGRRCLVGGACFGWGCLPGLCCASGAALTPGCRSRHARQPSAAASAGARLSTGERSPFVFGSLSMAFACEMRASPHDARYESGVPNSLRLVGGIGCVRRRIKSLGFLCSRCRGAAAFCQVLVDHSAQICAFDPQESFKYPRQALAAIANARLPLHRESSNGLS